MTLGDPHADLVFLMLMPGIASAFDIISKMPEAKIRTAIAALSTFHGPGTIAHDLALQMMSDELAGRVE